MCMITSFPFVFTDEPALGANIFQFEACPNQVILFKMKKTPKQKQNKEPKCKSKEQWPTPPATAKAVQT